MFEYLMDEIAKSYRAKSKINFLRDIAGQIEDDEKIQGLMLQSKSSKFLMITFDRKRNDKRFSYSHADLLLVVLDRISGGSGITKPLSQVRVVQSKWTRAQMLTILRYFSRNNREINFRRILIETCSSQTVGHKLDPSVYLR